MTELVTKTQPPDSGLSLTMQRTAPSILVVDDHEDTRALLRYVLESRRHQVSEADDGADAVGIAERIRPDLILMDSTLKQVDGLEATRRIRGMAHIRNIPIVFLSGHAQPQARALALACGANEYLVKPISLDELEIVVEQHLAAAHKRGMRRRFLKTIKETGAIL